MPAKRTPASRKSTTTRKSKSTRTPPSQRPKRAKDGTKVTKEDAIQSILKWKGKLYLAAADLGITRATLWNYTERWPELKDIIAEVKGQVLDIAEDKLLQAVQKGEGWAICFTLKCLGRSRGYSERIHLRHGGDEDAPPIRTENQSAISLMDVLDNLPKDVSLRVCQAAGMIREGIPVPNFDEGGYQELRNWLETHYQTIEPPGRSRTVKFSRLETNVWNLLLHLREETAETADLEIIAAVQTIRSQSEKGSFQPGDIIDLRPLPNGG